MDAILDTTDIFAMAAILAMATALDTEAIIAMATILAIKYKLLKKYIQKREASTEVSLFCWDTRTRTRKNRTRICCVTITPYPKVICLLRFQWLGYPDSNQEKQDQNLLCYHYTISQGYLSHSEQVPLVLNCGAKVLLFYELAKVL